MKNLLLCCILLLFFSGAKSEAQSWGPYTGPGYVTNVQQTFYHPVTNYVPVTTWAPYTLNYPVVVYYQYPAPVQVNVFYRHRPLFWNGNYYAPYVPYVSRVWYNY